MKKILTIGLLALLFACNNEKKAHLDQAIEKTSDSLVATTNKVNDTLKNKVESLKNNLPRVEVSSYQEVPISLQWIAFNSSEGKAKIKKSEENGWFAVEGEQTNSANEYLKIKGKLKRQDAEHIVFEGTIITYVKANNGGKPCEKIGRQIFLKKGDRRNYRLQNMSNCEGGSLVDYVDLFDLDRVL